MSYPAPDFLEDDIWFGPAFRSHKAEKKYEVKKVIEARIEEVIVTATKEPSNIHQKMYDLAVKSRSTTLHLGLAPKFGAGSEQIWESGAGM